MNPVASRFRADINDGIADAVRASVENFVFFEDSQREGVHERILRIRFRKIDFAANRRHAETVSIKRDSANDAFENAFVLLLVERSKAQAVHRRDGPCAHRKDVAQNAADARRRALERFNERRMVVRLDLECNGEAVADIDDSRVFTRPLQHPRASRRQSPQVNARAFVAAVLAPHHTEDAELCDCRLPLQDGDNLLIFAFREVVLREDVFTDHHFVIIWLRER